MLGVDIGTRPWHAPTNVKNQTETQESSSRVTCAGIGQVQLTLFLTGALFDEIQLSLFVAGPLYLVQFNCHFSWQAQYLVKLKASSQLGHLVSWSVN